MNRNFRNRTLLHTIIKYRIKNILQNKGKGKKTRRKILKREGEWGEGGKQEK